MLKACCADQERRRDHEAERLGGFEVHEQSELSAGLGEPIDLCPGFAVLHIGCRAKFVDDVTRLGYEWRTL